MVTKKSAPQSTQGKMAASRPPEQKSAARPAEQVKAAVIAKKSVVEPKKALSHGSTPTTTETTQMRKATESAPAAPSTAPGGTPPAQNLTRANATLAAAEDDNDDGSSLLAGPRNVQPYIVKRGEQYMSKEQAEHFRNILQTWKRDLMEEVDRTVTHMKDEAANFPDPNDRATQEEEFSLELRTRDRERKLIRKIDEALKRIEDGSYGYCLETGEEIGIKRLEARPVATLSIEAQERRERRERQYGDRDDRYR